MRQITFERELRHCERVEEVALIAPELPVAVESDVARVEAKSDVARAALDD